MSLQPAIYSADDIATPPLLPLKPPESAGVALSPIEVQADTVTPQQQQQNTDSNLSDTDKLTSPVHSLYSAHDLPIVSYSPHYSLHEAFSLPKGPPLLKKDSASFDRERDDDEESIYSVTSEPVNRNDIPTPTTPTPSLPGNISLRIPAHVISSRPLADPPPAAPVNSSIKQPLVSEATNQRPFNSLYLQTNPVPLPPTNPLPVSLSLPVGPLATGNRQKDDVLGLKEQLHQLMEEKAHLEGQLESVINECTTTLKERAQLQSKLTQAEGELYSLQEVPEKSTKLKASPEDGTDLQAEVSRLESTLGQKRRDLADKNRELERERQRVKQLSDDLDSSRKVTEEKQIQVQETNRMVSSLNSVLEEKNDTIQELRSQVASLKAGIDSTETSKGWLHDQLQNAIDSKSSLQEELRAARATSISHSIKIDTLQKENGLLRQQMSELQDSILQDKAKLVSELEAIEADVISKEGSYAQVQADKERSEQQLKLKSDQLDELVTTLADQKSTCADLSSRLDDARQAVALMEVEMKKLNENKNRLNDEVQQNQQQVLLKDQEIKELKGAKYNLHQRLQQAETANVTKDGSIQGLKDSFDLLGRELESVKETKESLNKELDRLQAVNARLETENEASENRCQNLDFELQRIRNQQRAMEMTSANMESELLSKQNELEEKEKALLELQSQSDELKQHFQSLQNQFDRIAHESGAGMEQKEKMIAQLLQERDTMKDEVARLSAQEKDWKQEIGDLKEQNAHLQGQLDSAVSTGPHLDDFKRLLEEKNALDSRLASERLTHQQEQIKAQAKVARLDTELKDVKKESKRKEVKYKQDLQNAEKLVEELQKQLDDIANNPVTQAGNNDEVDGLQEALEEKELLIQSLEQDRLSLEAETVELREKISQQEQHVSGIEQKLSTVTRQLEDEAQREREQLEEEKHQLIVETKHLKGRLAGIDKAQQCMREHTAGLEKSLALKESHLQQMSSETQHLLAKKSEEIDELKSIVANLQDNEIRLKTDLEQALTDSLLQRQRADETESQMANAETELNQLKEAGTHEKEKKLLRERVTELEQLKSDLQAELHTMKQQLSATQSASDALQRELQQKTELINVLQQNMALAKNELEQTKQELEQLQCHLSVKDSPAKPLPLLSSTPHFIDGSLSPVGKSGYSSSLEELQKLRLQEEVDKKRTGELSVLKSQLGSKSKTLKNLQSCLKDLKNDMTYIQSKMDQHSSSLQHSYRSSQQLEDRIKVLQLNRSISDTPSSPLN